MTTDETREAFLKDLAELMEKHGIAIGACSCCGHIGLEHRTEEKKVLTSARYLPDPDFGYSWYWEESK